MRQISAGKLLQGAGAAFLLQVTGLGLSYVANIMLARLMGPAEYGIYAFVVSSTLIFSAIAELGIPDLLLRYIPAYESAGKWSLFRGLVHRSRLLVIAAGCLIAVSGTLLLHTSLLPIRPDYIVPLSIGLWATPLWAMMRFHTFAARSSGRIVEAYLPPRIFRPAGLLLVALSTVVVGWQLTGTLGVLGLVVVLSLTIVFQFIVFGRHSPPALWQARPAFKMNEWLRVSVFLWMAVLFTMLEREIGILTVGLLLPPEEVGLYTAAVRISQIVDFPLLAINAVAVPMFATYHSQKEHRQLQKLVFRVVRWSLLAALIITLALVVAAPLVLSLLGRPFLAAERETVILAVKGLIATAMGPALPLLKVTAQQKAGMVVAGCSAIVSVILTVIGTSLWGITGAALAGLTAAVVAGMIQNVVVIRRLKLFPAIVFQLCPGA